MTFIKKYYDGDATTGGGSVAPKQTPEDDEHEVNAATNELRSFNNVEYDNEGNPLYNDFQMIAMFMAGAEWASQSSVDKKDLESSVRQDSSEFATLRSGFGNSDEQEKISLAYIKGATDNFGFCGLPSELAGHIKNNLETYLQSLPPSREDGWIKPKVVCLCGSTRFAEWFMIKRWELEKKGIITFGINILPDNYFAEGNSHGAEQEGVKDVLDELHKRKIDLSDEVFVLNVNGYIGESTRNEIEYAEKTGKPIKYLEPLPSPPKEVKQK